MEERRGLRKQTWKLLTSLKGKGFPDLSLSPDWKEREMMEVIRITDFGLLLSGLGVDSDALAVIPWVPGNYSSNRCLRNILTINPLYWQGRLSDGLSDWERNKTGDGRGERKETSSFSVVCEGVTTHVFCLTSKAILWKPWAPASALGQFYSLVYSRHSCSGCFFFKARTWMAFGKNFVKSWFSWLRSAEDLGISGLALACLVASSWVGRGLCKRKHF